MGREFVQSRSSDTQGTVALEHLLCSTTTDFCTAMATDQCIWERFVACKLTQSQSFLNSQNANSGSILGARSNNLTSGSIALRADAYSASLMRDLALKPVAELFSDKASQELANRNRYVDFVRLVLSCLASSSGREKKADIAIRSIKVQNL